jgi:putative DNA methylase
LDRPSRLSQWRIGHSGKQDVAPSSDYPEHVFYNMALNTFINFAARSFSSNVDSLSLVTKNYELIPRNMVQVAHASDLDQNCDYFITDPPYADAIHYHEITEYFIAWLSKTPPRPDWVWDSRRELAIRGESRAFRRAMVEAYAAMAAHMPDNGFQVVMISLPSSAFSEPA